MITGDKQSSAPQPEYWWWWCVSRSSVNRWRLPVGTAVCQTSPDLRFRHQLRISRPAEPVYQNPLYGLQRDRGSVLRVYSSRSGRAQAAIQISDFAIQFFRDLRIVCIAYAFASSWRSPCVSSSLRCPVRQCYNILILYIVEAYDHGRPLHISCNAGVCHRNLCTFRFVQGYHSFGM